MQALPTSYHDYINGIGDFHESLVPEKANNVIEKICSPNDISHVFSPVTYVLDFSRKKYFFMHEGCVRFTGYSGDYFMKKGLEFALSKWKKEDFELYNKMIFPENMKFLKEHAEYPVPGFIFSHTFRFRLPDGNFTKILQRSSFIRDSSNHFPIGVVGVLTDITHFLNDQSMVHTIEEVRKNETRLLYKKVYFPCERFAQFTKKEIEVLKWICEGFSSKKIAEKMCISFNTVNNHRKKMLYKTNCNSSAELLHYAMKNGLL